MTSTFPINITVNKDAKCNLQCNYSFSYPPTSLKIQRRSDRIMLSTDETIQPPVIYNNRNYNISNVLLFRPSLHKFAGISADAEMLIVHTSTNSPNMLMVCVPITKSSTSTTDATMFLDLIGTEISRTGTGSDGETVFNSPTFTLNKFVPMKPYVSYTGGEYNTIFDVIVFQKENAVYISAVTFDVLTSSNNGSNPLWMAHSTPVVNKSVTPAIFYNNTGPVVRTGTGDSIYISCQPTGEDGEILTKAIPNNSSQMIDRLSIKEATNNIGLKIIIGISLMILIWKLSMKIFRGLSGSKKTD